jgi:hypothetical protein
VIWESVVAACLSTSNALIYFHIGSSSADDSCIHHHHFSTYNDRHTFLLLWRKIIRRYLLLWKSIDLVKRNTKGEKRKGSTRLITRLPNHLIRTIGVSKWIENRIETEWIRQIKKTGNSEQRN